MHAVRLDRVLDLNEASRLGSRRGFARLRTVLQAPPDRGNQRRRNLIRVVRQTRRLGTVRLPSIGHLAIDAAAPVHVSVVPLGGEKGRERGRERGLGFAFGDAGHRVVQIGLEDALSHVAIDRFDELLLGLDCLAWVWTEGLFSPLVDFIFSAVGLVLSLATDPALAFEGEFAGAGIVRGLEGPGHGGGIFE